MESAEEIYRKLRIRHKGTFTVKDSAVIAMKIYAKQVAEQALEDAAENTFRSTMFGHNADLSLITNTPILLP